MNITLHDILSDPDTAIRKNWPTTEQCPHKEEIIRLAGTIRALKPRTKSLKKSKQALSRRFRDKALTDDAQTKLVQEMQATSSELKALEAERKQLEKSLRQLFDTESATPDFPPGMLYRPPASIDEPAKVQVVSDTFAKQWDEYANNHPQATIYHLYSWRDIIQQSFGQQPVYLAAIDSQNQYRGILPLILLRSKLFGAYAISQPYFNYGGPLADSLEIGQQLLAKATQLCQQKHMDHLEIRATQVLNEWPTRTEKVSMILALPENTTLLNKQLGAKLRAQINQAERHQLSTCIGGIELLDDFYRIFSKNMRDLGTPVYAKDFFARILSELPKQTKLVVLYSAQKPISTALLIGYRELLEIPWASTLRSYNKLNANMLLYKTVLTYAVNSGYRYFDFGRSSLDSNTYRFKKQWGAKPLQHYWHYWLPDGKQMPQLNPNNPKYQLLIAAWKRLPLFISNTLGPHIVKNLP